MYIYSYNVYKVYEAYIIHKYYIYNYRYKDRYNSMHQITFHPHVHKHLLYAGNHPCYPTFMY